MSEIKKVFRGWTGAKPEIIGDWLEKMEAEGWHLFRVTWGGTRFHFHRGEPRKMRYCVDYQNTTDPNYVGIFEDAGWEKMLSYAGWYFWRMPYSDKKPEIFTDLDSLIERNKRLITLFFVLLAAQLPIFTVNFHNFS